LKVVEEQVNGTRLTLIDFEPTPDRICDDLAKGLTAVPRKLPPKYFYDDVGARLFERITELPEYYPTRTEIEILQQRGTEIAEAIGESTAIIEFGSGSGEKTWILLRHLHGAVAYVPVDISRAQLIDFAGRVVAEHPELHVVPVCADYTAELTLPPLPEGVSRCVAFFPGSTIGNFEPADAARFLCRVRRLVGSDGGLLLGIDLRKDPAIIEAAYNDAEGVTAKFNLNLLRRANRECGADFDLDGFRHLAVYDEVGGRIEMRLVALRDQIVRLMPDPDEPDRIELDFREGEYIITEYSHKYDLDGFTELAESAGWRRERVWMDERHWFAVVLLG